MDLSTWIAFFAAAWAISLSPGAGAVAAMGDTQWFATNRESIMQSRTHLTAGLRERGFEVLPSAANFVFARHPERRGARLAAQLREQRVLVRNFAKPERIADFLRITIGTEAQCAALLAALDVVLAQAE